jgi:hypothetical protein
MAVVGAKGTFAGPGGTSGNGSSYKRRELVCDEVGQEICCIIYLIIGTDMSTIQFCGAISA